MRHGVATLAVAAVAVAAAQPARAAPVVQVAPAVRAAPPARHHGAAVGPRPPRRSRGLDRRRSSRDGARCRSGGAVDHPSTIVDPDREQIKLVYAHFADRPDNQRAYVPLLQRDAVIIEHYMAGQSGGRKTLRFDLGTDCSPRAADVLSLALPIRRKAFLALGGIDATRRYLLGIIRHHLPRRTIERRDFLVLLDRAGPRVGLIVDGRLASAPISGWGDIPVDGSHGADNVANLGGLVAVVKTPDFQPRALNVRHRRLYHPELVLHEISHMLGAVQRSAPHATSDWHCRDGFDVMCAEDSTRRGARRHGRCRLHHRDAIPATYDCGRDDYFDPHPASGSYLSRHWNIYDSAFLARCSESPRICGPKRR